MVNFSTQQLKRARHTNMFEYMLAQGEPFEKVGQREYAHAEHDSLRANPKTGVVTWYSHNQLSSFDNAIDFATEFYQKPYTDTVSALLNFKAPKQIKAIGNGAKKQHQTPFSLAKLNSRGGYDTNQLSEKGRSFLVNERFLDPSLVDKLASKHFISSDNKDNILFKWVDPKTPNKYIGADIQGTYRQSLEKRINRDNGKLGRPYYKGIAANSSSTGGFRIPVIRDISEPIRLYVTEAPIEAISLLEHNLKYTKPERAIYFSQSGLKYDAMVKQIESLMPYVKEGEQLDLVFAVNNDQHGQQYVKDSLKALKKDEIDVHPFLQMPNITDGDWNEALELEKTGQLKSRLVKERDHKKAQALLKNETIVQTQPTVMNPLKALTPEQKTAKSEKQLEVTR